MARRMILNEPLRLDLVTKATMGKTGDGAVEALLTANPGLAAKAYVDAGRALTVPDAPETPATPLVNPWS